MIACAGRISSFTELSAHSITPRRSDATMLDAMSALPLTRSDDSTETVMVDAPDKCNGDSAKHLFADNVDSSNNAKKQYHRDPSAWDKPVPVVKAYRNVDFLNSSHARHRTPQTSHARHRTPLSQSLHMLWIVCAFALSLIFGSVWTHRVRRPF